MHFGYDRVHMLPPKPTRMSLLVSAAAVLPLLGCAPKPPPPKLPPRQLPQVQKLDDPTGQRGNVVDEAVQIGSNTAKLSYNCGPPHGKNVEGSGRLSVQVTRCEFDQGTRTLTLTNEAQEECPTFLISLTDYRGGGTYNTASINQVSFGPAKVRQNACRWEGTICMNWSRAGSHPEANCTVEITNDGGLQYGTAGATVSGTFSCSAFTSPFKGCAGVSATPGCAITSGSFSVAGCSTSGTAAPAVPTPPAPGRKRGR